MKRIDGAYLQTLENQLLVDAALHGGVQLPNTRVGEHHVLLGVRLERRKQHLVENQPQTEHVGLRLNTPTRNHLCRHVIHSRQAVVCFGVSLELLRRRVSTRARRYTSQPSRERTRRVTGAVRSGRGFVHAGRGVLQGEVAKPEVADERRSLVVEEDVRGLEVAMNDVQSIPHDLRTGLLVHVLKPVEKLWVKREYHGYVVQNLPDSCLVGVQLAMRQNKHSHCAALNQVRQRAVLVVLHLDEQNVARVRLGAGAALRRYLATLVLRGMGELRVGSRSRALRREGVFVRRLCLAVTRLTLFSGFVITC